MLGSQEQLRKLATSASSICLLSPTKCVEGGGQNNNNDEQRLSTTMSNSSSNTLSTTPLAPSSMNTRNAAATTCVPVQETVVVSVTVDGVSGGERRDHRESGGEGGMLGGGEGCGSGSADIQLHLQSMFYLLRPEETLKMVSVE